jgi:hypothetical protein
MSKQKWKKDYEPRTGYYARPNQKPNINADLYNARIIQRNLVYVIGLAPEIATEKVANIPSL